MENYQGILKGLQSNRKYLPTWYNYDDVGSKLNHICTTENSDYYITRGEQSILRDKIQNIIPRVPYQLTLVDLGSGNCHKTRFVIDELLKRQGTLSFYPEDISEDFLLRSSKQLAEEYGDSLVITPIPEDYVEGIKQLKKVKGPKFILWLGSIICMSYDDQVNMLRLISTMMTDKCNLVFSADITQDRHTIVKAYDDEAGLMRNFIQNGVTRLNKETGSEIDKTKFKWEVDFVLNKDPNSMSYVRKYMEAKESVQYKMPQLNMDFTMKKGERLYFHEGEGFSCKYTLEQLRNIVEKAGLRLTDTWTDEDKHVVFCRCITV